MPSGSTSEPQHAHLGRSDHWGRTAGKLAIARGVELGGRFVAEEYFDAGSTDFYGLQTKVRAAGPDALVAAAFVEDGVPTVRQFRELQMKPLFMGVGVIWTSPGFLESAGLNANGIYVSAGLTTSTSPRLKGFVA